ncbi:MAG: GNAT family N-acetyltransferase [Candidatus Diapherotrites archaeon]|nr:GNAT family N-acetyltransferase [Candidatus Diapherotrites archaeon]
MYAKNVRIREALEDDIDNIIPLKRKFMDMHGDLTNYYKCTSDCEKKLRKHMISELDKNDSYLVVAEYKGDIIGYLEGHIQERAPIYTSENRIVGEINTGYLEESYWSKGIFEKLVDAMVRWFKNNGVIYVNAMVDAKNPIFLRGWKKYGFTDRQHLLIRKLE